MRMGAPNGQENGFTLAELLVVMLIIGVLAAVAVPAFYGQRDKALDAQAKVYVRTAENALETYAVDHDGTYDGADAAALRRIEPTLTGAVLQAIDAPAGGSDSSEESFAVTVLSPTGNTFTITRHDNGSVSLTCTAAGRAGCPGGGGGTGTW